jgi:hypothetical protein
MLELSFIAAVYSVILGRLAWNTGFHSTFDSKGLRARNRGRLHCIRLFPVDTVLAEMEAIPMKATIYTREPGTRKFKKARARFYADGTVFVLRTADSWETLGTVSFSEAQTTAAQRRLDFAKGFRAMELAGTKQPQPAAKMNALMLDAAINKYFDFIATKAVATRKAYGRALRLFLRAVGDKTVSEITEEDLAAFHRSISRSRCSSGM